MKSLQLIFTHMTRDVFSRLSSSVGFGASRGARPRHDVRVSVVPRELYRALVPRASPPHAPLHDLEVSLFRRRRARLGVPRASRVGFLSRPAQHIHAPPPAANAQSTSHGNPHPSARAHSSTRRFPACAAAAHTRQSHGMPLSRPHRAMRSVRQLEDTVSCARAPARTVACLAARETRASIAVSCVSSRVRTSRSNTSGNAWPCTKPSMAPDRAWRERDCDASVGTANQVAFQRASFRGNPPRFGLGRNRRSTQEGVECGFFKAVWFVTNAPAPGGAPHDSPPTYLSRGSPRTPPRTRYYRLAIHVFRKGSTMIYGTTRRSRRVVVVAIRECASDSTFTCRRWRC
jgi:hypothetical protein